MRLPVIACALFLASATALAQAPSEAELRFLNRITYGATARDVDDYRALGREGYLRRQLAFHGDEGLPREALEAIAALPISRARPEDLAEKVISARRAARFKSADEKREAAKQLRREFAQLDFQVFERRTLRALWKTCRRARRRCARARRASPGNIATTRAFRRRTRAPAGPARCAGAARRSTAGRPSANARALRNYFCSAT